MKDKELYRVLLGLKDPWQIEAVALSEAEETITVRVGLPPNTPLNLPPTYQRREFEHLRNSNLRTARAWAIKEQFQRLWFYRYPGCARRFFEDWHEWAIKSRLEPMKKVAQRLLKHLPRILNYIRHGVTNARAEGINNKIQTIKKKAYGFRSIPRFINAIYFHCAGLKLHPL
jgi:transposase